MMIRKFILVTLCILANLVSFGCAGPILNSYTESLGPRVGSIQEREVLTNLGRFIDNPWSIPGHVELNAGIIQVQNQVAVGYKLPDLTTIARAAGATASSLTNTTTHEFDVNSAQTQDQESYNILPVTDSDDLRRMRALYFYSVCPDIATFRNEWLLAAQNYNHRVAHHVATPPPSSGSAKVKETIQKFADGTIDVKTATDQLVALSKKKLDQAAQAELTKKIEGILTTLQGDIDTSVTDISQALGLRLGAPFAAAPSGKPNSAKEASKSGGGDGDSYDFELAKFRVLVRSDGLGRERWLYWRKGPGPIGAACPGEQFRPAADPDRLYYLGSAAGYDLYATDPKRFSDLVLFILGGIPNTVGAHVIDQNGPLGDSKTRNTQITSLNGSFATITTGKH